MTLIWTQPLLAENVGVSYFPKYGRQLFSTELQTGVEASRSWISGDELLDLFRDGTWWTAVAQLQNLLPIKDTRLSLGLECSHSGVIIRYLRSTD